MVYSFSQNVLLCCHFKFQYKQFIQKVLGGSVGGAAQFSRGGFGGPLIKSHVLAVDDRNWQFLSPSLQMKQSHGESPL